MRTILFAGHRLDEGNRSSARFPPAMEAAARGAIRGGVMGIVREHAEVAGMAGGASGGDILFHEVCARLRVPTRLYLPLAVDAFVAASVAPAGEDWVRRFYAIAARVPTVIAPTAGEAAARSGDGGDIWERNNLWLLDTAAANGVNNVTLLALWNGEGGDGRGGTDHLVQTARARGVDVRILDTRTIFDL